MSEKRPTISLEHFEFIEQVLDNCLLDLSYYQKLPFAPNELEQIYFQQALSRIEGAKKRLQVIYLNQLQLSDPTPIKKQETKPKKKSLLKRVLGKFKK